MRAQSRAEREADVIEMADRAFAEHLNNLSGYTCKQWPGGVPQGHWYVQRPDTGIYDFEVVFLKRNRLFVHGDIPAVLFCPSGPMTNARSAVSWVANTPHLDYLSEKVRVPERYTWDAAVAISDLDDWLRHDDSGNKSRREAIRELGVKLGRDGITTERELHEDLNGIHKDAWEFTWGRVVNSDIIWAWRAVVKLDQLLTKAEEAWA